MQQPSESSAATRLLIRLGEFANELDDEERELLAVLLGPGVQQLTDDEVIGFGGDTVRWEPGSLRDQLAEAVETSEWRITER